MENVVFLKVLLFLGPPFFLFLTPSGPLLDPYLKLENAAGGQNSYKHITKWPLSRPSGEPGDLRGPPQNDPQETKSVQNEMKNRKKGVGPKALKTNEEITFLIYFDHFV